MEIKDKIMDVTIDLIKEADGNVDKITIRKIAKRAGIGVGLINYHFQSKKNLVDICVQQIISGVIAQSKPDLSQFTPIEKLKSSVKVPIDFLMENPEIMQAQDTATTFHTLARYYSHASNLKQSEDTFFKTAFLIHGLQGIFLRWELYKDRFDFSDKQQRDNLIDDLVQKLFGAENE